MNIRRATSLTMLISFIPLVLTSVVLYVLPEGRVAYWSDWQWLGLDKPQWDDLHINIGWLFIAAGVLHLVLNWKPIVNYMKNKAREFKVFTVEFNVALLVTVIFTVGTLYLIPPFSTILEFGDSFKNKASDKYGEPPYGHAESSSLKVFARRTELDIDKIQEQLKKAGIQFTDIDQTILEVAKANNITPKGVYEVIKKPEVTPVKGVAIPLPDAPPPGLGKKVLKDICATYGLDAKAIVEGLAAKGITADLEKSLKEIGSDNNTDPHAIFDYIYEITNN